MGKIKARDIFDHIRSLKAIVTLVYRFEPGKLSLRGVPDLFICTALDDYWVEVKIDQDKLSAMQRRFLQAVKKPVILEDQKQNERGQYLYQTRRCLFTEPICLSHSSLMPHDKVEMDSELLPSQGGAGL